MTIAKYRPMGVLSPFNELVNEFFGRDFGQLLGQDDDNRRFVPAVNIVERDGEFELRLSAPGFGKEDLKLNVEDDTLTISAEKKTQDLKENERYTRREFVHGSFTRSFRLPQLVSPEAISAEYVNGVLHVRIPKAEAAKPKAREIAIG
ncbi:MAG: Hsp20/alpha crystallin family protein [Flavobacteriales bacterium]